MVRCGGRAQGGGSGSVHDGRLVQEAAGLSTSSTRTSWTRMTRTGRCLPLPSTDIFVLFRYSCNAIFGARLRI
jgi:hypothetical protein